MTGVLLALALTVAGGDTLRLSALQEEALRADPRTRQAALQEEATRLRLRTLAAERLPQLAVRGEATHQSEVAAIRIELPGGTPPAPPHDRWEVGVEGQLILHDGGMNARRREAERAQLEVTRAELAATLFPLRAEVNEAFFAAALLQERLRESASLREDLEARLRVVRARVRGGAALPGDTAVVLAALLRAGQERETLAADRRAALGVLGRLTGRAIGAEEALALPELAALFARARTADAPRAHPQFAVFAARRARLDRDAALAGARTRPQLSAFGQLGYGSPGLAQFETEPHDFWIAGVRLRWTPWDWGSSRRDRAAIHLQQQAVVSEEEAFAARLERQTADEVETVSRLERALETDERIVALRAQVERQASAQFDERAITADQYVDARTDLQDARVARDRHRVELARARAQYLTTLGMELR